MARMIRFAPRSLSSSGIPRIVRSQRGIDGSRFREMRFSLGRVRAVAVIQTSLDNQSGDHAEHSVIRFGMRKYVAVESPGAGVVAVHDHIPAFTGRDVQGVALPRSRLGPAILGDHSHVHAVKVHWMDHHYFVHEAEPQFLSLS